eukprot:SAG11_NODE_6865_length_1234_cov_0.728634_3_plen_138_part_01
MFEHHEGDECLLGGDPCGAREYSYVWYTTSLPRQTADVQAVNSDTQEPAAEEVEPDGYTASKVNEYMESYRGCVELLAQRSKFANNLDNLDPVERGIRLLLELLLDDHAAVGSTSISDLVAQARTRKGSIRGEFDRSN